MRDRHSTFNRRRLLKLAGLGAACAVAGRHARAAEAPAAGRPNILIIMADDLGYECLGAYGGTSYKTPNLDKLAAAGLRFDNCFSTPKCSPSRVTILTGRYTFRTTTRWGHIPPDEITFGHVLGKAGYATALAGKWQLGKIVDQPDRVAKGGFEQSCVWAWHEGPRYRKPTIYHNDKLRTDVADRYGPDVYCEFLIDFIESNKDRPFLAYYPMTLTHYPKPNEPKGPNGKWETFAEMVTNMDRQVGKLVAALDRLKLRRKTVILFSADNGSPTKVTSRVGDRKIKGGKAKLTDAGTRVPLIANCPGVTPAGRTNDDLIDFSDFLPTLAELASAKLPADLPIDGRSFTAQLQGRPGRPREWVFTELGGKRWVRNKRWKLYQDGRLIDMQADSEEKNPIPAGSSAAADQQRGQLQVVMKRLLSK